MDMYQRDINQRFIKFLEESKIPKASVASLFNVKPQRITQWKENERPFSLEYITRFCEAHPELNANWLLTGKGQMTSIVQKTETENINEPLENYCPNCSEKLLRIQLLENNIKVLNDLNAEKQKVIALLEGLTGKAHCG